MTRSSVLIASGLIMLLAPNFEDAVAEPKLTLHAQSRLVHTSESARQSAPNS